MAIDLLVQNNFGDTRSGGLAGPTGLVIILLLVVGTILLIRNMNARLRRLPERFEPERFEHPRAGRVPAESTGDPAPLAAPGDVDEPKERPPGLP
jgi:hypothetical protein